MGDIRLAEEIIYSANPVVNAILKVKSVKAKEKEIPMQVTTLLPQRVSVDIGDMGVLYGNLLDNAIEAAMAVEQEKRYVHVESKFQEGRLLLSIKNSKPSGTSSCQQTRKKDTGGEYPQIGVGWDAYWYGDCVSLVVRSRYGGTAPWRYSGWCFDFATGRQLTVAEMLQRMGLDPDTVQQQVQRQAMQAFDREMAQGAYYEGLRLGGNLSEMRMGTLEYNALENLCLLLPQQDRLVLRGKYYSETDWGWQQLDVEIPLASATPADTPVLTDTYDGVQVQLKGTQGTITLSPAPKTDQWGDIGIRVEQEHSYPILGAYNEYVDVCIGEQEDGFFRPVVYLLTKDGVVEYVDVLRCLMFGDAMICQDPIYFANNGVALERSGSEVNLRRADGSVLELAPLSAEWSAQEIPYSVTGSYNYTSETGWNWMDLTSDGSVQLGVQDNSRIYRGDAAYLGVVPEGVVLGISADEELGFVAAFKNDQYNENLTLTMIAGQNPFAEGETQLQMTRSYG